MINNLEEPEFIASVTGKRWTPGRTLRVSFLDGDPMVDKKVKEIASEWLDHANIKFEFIDDKNGDIRISYRERLLVRTG
jgi:serralysin